MEITGSIKRVREQMREPEGCVMLGLADAKSYLHEEHKNSYKKQFRSQSCCQRFCLSYASWTDTKD